MAEVSDIYKELLTSNEGDILVKLKDGKQLRIISFLIKRRSPVFKSMLESSMKEAAAGVVDLSSEYTLEAFREFMAYIYYNKLHTGSYVPLMFEILCIAEYYDVESYKTYINDRIVELITNVPICLTIAAEALRYGILASEIHHRCLAFLVTALEPPMRVCYDKSSEEDIAWCCSDHSTKNKSNYFGDQYQYMYTIGGQVACIYRTMRKNYGYNNSHLPSDYKQRCCLHDPSLPLMSADQLPDFIVDDINSFRTGDDSETTADR